MNTEEKRGGEGGERKEKDSSPFLCQNMQEGKKSLRRSPSTSILHLSHCTCTIVLIYWTSSRRNGRDRGLKGWVPLLENGVALFLVHDMKFGRSLRNAAYGPWKEHYLDYDLLKKVIYESEKAAQEGEDSREASLAFQKAFDDQLQHVVEFYKDKERELLQEGTHVQHKVRRALDAHSATPSAERAAALDAAAISAQRLAEQVGHLVAFVSLNMIAIRKIMKKYARRIGTTLPPTPGYLAIEVEHPEAEHAPVTQGSFLPASIAADLEKMQEHAELKNLVGVLRGFLDEAQEHRCLLVHMASRPLPSFGDRVLSMLDHDVEALRLATEEADRNAALVHPIPWVERAAGMFEPPPPEEYATANLAGLILNNVSCMLYMANYTAGRCDSIFESMYDVNVFIVY